MIKYIPTHTTIVLEEVPNMVSLAVAISNCKGKCVGCHSSFLREDIGQELTLQRVDALIQNNYGINCFLFLGEGSDPTALLHIATYIKTKYNLKLAIYSGRQSVEPCFYKVFDYIKVGPYIPTHGPLNSKTTNQRLYKIENNNIIDITFMF